MSICIIDTSVFCNILKVPGKCQKHAEVIKLMKEKIDNEESLLLPMASIFETGNHIAQNGDGNQRRICADKFVHQLKGAIEGKAPWIPMKFLEVEKVSFWLNEFSDCAMREISFGDLSIIEDWEEQKRIHSGRRVYIWSLDNDLKGYDHKPNSP